MNYRLTTFLIVSNVLMYLLLIVLSDNVINITLSTLVDMGALYGPYIAIDGAWWRLFSSLFLHAGITHIIMNMFSLYLLGREAERYFETKTYLWLYFSSGLMGSMLSLCVHPEVVAVGASGAIFGIFGAMAGFFLANRSRLMEDSQAFMQQFAVIIILNLIIGFSIESIDVTAHIGGLLMGILGGFVLSIKPQWLWGYIVASLLVLALIATLWLG